MKNSWMLLGLIATSGCVLPQTSGSGTNTQNCVSTKSGIGMPVCQATASTGTTGASGAPDPTPSASPTATATPAPSPSPSPSPTPAGCNVGSAVSIAQLIYNSGWYGFDMAQSFAPTGRMRLHTVKLMTGAYHYNPADGSISNVDPAVTWLDISIHPDTGGQPDSASAIGSAKLTALDMYGALTSIGISQAPILQAGTKYWIVAKPHVGDPNDSVLLGADGNDDYGGGEKMIANGSSFTTDAYDPAGNDMTFEVDGVCN